MKNNRRHSKRKQHEMNLDRIIQAALRTNFLSFARKAIREHDGTKLGDQPYLRYLADELNLFADNETHRLIVNLPPGHLKTWLASTCLTAWLLARDSSLKVIIVTHAEHLSKAIARNIRSILQSGWCKEVFASRIKKGHAAVTDFGTTAGGGVFVTSFGGSFTGRRADLIIVDDPHDIKDKLEEIESTIESFNTVLLSRLNDRKDGRVLVVAQRVHEQDLSAHLLRKKKWKHVLLPLIATRDQTYQTSSGVWRRRKGDVLRPDKYGADEIDELREEFRFDMLYQQDCDFQTLPAIRAGHFPSIKEPMPPSAPIVLSVDPGVTSGRRSAFSVIQAWRVGAERFYLIDQFREQCEFYDLIEAVRRLRRQYKPQAILIERAANGHALISKLGRIPKLAKLVRPIDPDGRSKSARFRVHAKTILAKRIHLPADQPWRDEFISEFIEFPHGQFTDQVDATTQFLDHAAELAKLKPALPAGNAVLARNSSSRSRTPSFLGSAPGLPSNGQSSLTGSERGLAAGRHSDGRTITGGYRLRQTMPHFRR
jgi:predicted phage terminase large subunit-like protein